VVTASKKLAVQILNGIIDTLIPEYCVGCKRVGRPLCSHCISRLEGDSESGVCPFCKEKVLAKTDSYGILCKVCRLLTSLDGLITAFSYENRVVKKAIKEIKYKSVRSLIPLLVTQLADTYNAIPYSNRPKIIADHANVIRLIPIPLHKKRLYMRGFNQAHEISNKLSESLGWAVDTKLLYRKRMTDSQSKLSKNERLHNMKEAFMLKKEPDPTLVYILVDDVITTGATIGEAAKLLKKNGVKKVWGMCLAHG